MHKSIKYLIITTLATIAVAVTILSIYTTYNKNKIVITAANSIKPNTVLEQAGTTAHYHNLILMYHQDYITNTTFILVFIAVTLISLYFLCKDDPASKLFTQQMYSAFCIAITAAELSIGSLQSMLNNSNNRNVKAIVSEINNKADIVEYVLSKQTPTIKVEDYTNENNYTVTLGIPAKTTQAALNIAGNVTTTVVEPTIKAVFSPKEINAINNEAKKLGMAEISVKQVLAAK